MTIENRILQFVFTYPGRQRMNILDGVKSQDKDDRTEISIALDHLVQERRLIGLEILCPIVHEGVLETPERTFYFPKGSLIQLS